MQEIGVLQEIKASFIPSLLAGTREAMSLPFSSAKSLHISRPAGEDLNIVNGGDG